MATNQPRTVGLNDLGQLTIRANVVFAVRCAQRIRPCFQLPPDAPHRREQMATIDAAIRLAARFCQGLPAEPGRAVAAAQAAAVVAEATYEFTNFAAFAAVRAAEAAAHAEEFRKHPGDSGSMAVVAAAFGAARVLAANADMFALPTVTDALYADVQKLLNLANDAGDDVIGPAVDPSENGPLGPLWPAGPPACFGG